MTNRFWLLTVLLLLGITSVAQGAVTPSAELSVDSLVESFRTGAFAWIPKIIDIAMVVFWSLATFEFTLCFGKLAIQGTDFSEVTVELFRRIIILSFGYFLLSEPGIFWTVIEGFHQSANLAVGDPATTEYIGEKVLKQAILLVQQITGLSADLEWYKLGQHIMLSLTGLIILWALGVAAGQMLLVMCEMYIVISAGLLTLGLYSFEPTREYPMKLFGAIIGTGMKLFVLQLIIALGFTLVAGWVSLGATEIGSYMIMAGGAIAFKEIAVKVPDYIQGLFSGSPGSGISAGGAVATAGAVAGAVAGVAAAAVPGKRTVGAVMAIREAITEGRGQGATGAGLVGATMKNLVKAGVGVAKDSAAGSVGGRMGEFNRAQRLKRDADNIGGDG